MPYRINDIDTERRELQGWAAAEHEKFNRRAWQLLAWTVVTAGWGGLNLAWSEDLRAREPAEVRVIMPTDFCAPEVLSDHERELRETLAACNAP